MKADSAGSVLLEPNPEQAVGRSQTNAVGARVPKSEAGASARESQNAKQRASETSERPARRTDTTTEIATNGNRSRERPQSMPRCAFPVSPGVQRGDRSSF